jgi:hypothetical protein
MLILGHAYQVNGHKKIAIVVGFGQMSAVERLELLLSTTIIQQPINSLTCHIPKKLRGKIIAP